MTGIVHFYWLAFVPEIWTCFWGKNLCYYFGDTYIFLIYSGGPKWVNMQAFKIIVTDPDSVLNSLTREVKEVGPDGQEVSFVREIIFSIIFLLILSKSICSFPDDHWGFIPMYR